MPGWLIIRKGCINYPCLNNGENRWEFSAPEIVRIYGKHFEISLPSSSAILNSESTPERFLLHRVLCVNSSDISGMAYMWVGKYNDLLTYK
jgi:hypothetical protein